MQRLRLDAGVCLSDAEVNERKGQKGFIRSIELFGTAVADNYIYIYIYIAIVLSVAQRRAVSAVVP